MGRTALLLLVAIHCISFNSYAQQVYQSLGKVSKIKVDNSVSVQTERGHIQVLIYSPTVVRVRISKTKNTEDFSYAVIQQSNTSFKTNEEKDILEIATDSIKIKINKLDAGIAFYNQAGKLLNQDYSLGAQFWNDETTVHKKMHADEKYIGLGEKTGGLNKRGSSFTNWNTDDFGYEKDADPLYKSIPFYIGIHDKLCYGVFLDNSFKTHFNFGASTDEQFMSFTTSSGEMNYYFFGASSVARIIEDYTWLTGRMTMPPMWSLGFQQSRWSYMNEQDVMNVANTFRSKKIPCDVIYNDIDYMDRYRVFTWNKETFSNPTNYISNLNKLGFHPVVIIDPGIAVADDYDACKRGIAQDCFAKYPDGKLYVGSVWPGRCYFPDFTKPSARKWWGDELATLSKQGLEGFWNDMNEPAAWGQSIPDLVQFDFEGKKSSMKQVHNIYGMQMTRATYDGARKSLNGKRPFVLTRATFSGGQRYSAVWTGDIDATEDHMLLGVRLVNSLGLCGFSFAGTDIGGFTEDPSKELFLRWLNVGVYTPFMRSHSAKGTRSREPWAMGENVEEDARKMIETRYQLLPYMYSMFRKSQLNGLPVQRSMAIDFTYDENIYLQDFENQFLFGDHMLVAPSISSKEVTKVYLPAGNWYRFGTDAKFEGNKEVLAASRFNNLPVFVSEGAVIPMQPVIQHTGESSGDTLYLHVYAGKVKKTSFYYEDDGATYDYEQGKYHQRTFEFDGIKNELVLSKAEGTYTSKFKKVKVILHGFNNKKEIVVDNSNNSITIAL